MLFTINGLAKSERHGPVGRVLVESPKLHIEAYANGLRELVYDALEKSGGNELQIIDVNGRTDPADFIRQVSDIIGGTTRVVKSDESDRYHGLTFAQLQKTDYESDVVQKTADGREVPMYQAELPVTLSHAAVHRDNGLLRRMARRSPRASGLELIHTRAKGNGTPACCDPNRGGEPPEVTQRKFAQETGRARGTGEGLSQPVGPHGDLPNTGRTFKADNEVALRKQAEYFQGFAAGRRAGGS